MEGVSSQPERIFGEPPKLPVAHVIDTVPATAPFQKVDEFLEPVIDRFAEDMRGDFGKFRNLLKSCGGVVAGGSILKALTNFEGSKTDIDVYIPAHNYQRFIAGLIGGVEGMEGIFNSLEDRSTRIIDASVYCRSFLYKNGIRRVTTLEVDNANNSFTIDVMAVRGRRTIQQVVTNFDLTFCQVWYDGDSVYATNPDHIKNRSGYLQGDYVYTFFKGNRFLRNRVEKYMNRGFKISIGETVFDKSKPEGICNYDRLINPYNTVDRLADPVFQQNWQRKLLNRHLAGYSREFNERMKGPEYILLLDDPVDTQEKPKMYVELPLQERDDVLKELCVSVPATTQTCTYYRGSNRLLADNGYDTDDLESIENAYVLALDWAKRTKNDKVIGDGELTGELAYARAVNNLIITHTFPTATFQYHRWRGGVPFAKANLGTYLDETALLKMTNTYNDIEDGEFKVFTRPKKTGRRARQDVNFYSGKELAEYYLKLVADLRQRKVPAGADGYYFADEGDLVYDIHEHPLEAGINQENIMAYLDSKKDEPNKAAVPCYYSGAGCDKNLSYAEVYYMAGADFFNKVWHKVKKPRLGLDNYIELFTSVLYDTPSRNTLGFGMVFHDTICPFCLEPISREEGCMYMTHKVTGRGEAKDSPFCNPVLLVKELFNKYQQAARRNLQLEYGRDVDIDEFVKLEVCVECGRPCYHHTHFSTEYPYRKIDNLTGQDPETGIAYAYSKCPAGGRTELFARVLAIRDVYRRSGDAQNKDSLEERRIAALTADNGFSQFMDQARAIVAKLPAEREFGNAPLPATKRYKNYVDGESEGETESDLDLSAIAGENQRQLEEDQVQDPHKDPIDVIKESIYQRADLAELNDTLKRKLRTRIEDEIEYSQAYDDWKEAYDLAEFPENDDQVNQVREANLLLAYNAIINAGEEIIKDFKSKFLPTYEQALHIIQEKSKDPLEWIIKSSTKAGIDAGYSNESITDFIDDMKVEITINHPEKYNRWNQDKNNGVLWADVYEQAADLLSESFGDPQYDEIFKDKQEDDFAMINAVLEAINAAAAPVAPMEPAAPADREYLKNPVAFLKNDVAQRPEFQGINDRLMNRLRREFNELENRDHYDIWSFNRERYDEDPDAAEADDMLLSRIENAWNRVVQAGEAIIISFKRNFLPTREQAVALLDAKTNDPTNWVRVSAMMAAVQAGYNRELIVEAQQALEAARLEQEPLKTKYENLQRDPFNLELWKDVYNEAEKYLDSFYRERGDQARFGHYLHEFDILKEVDMLKIAAAFKALGHEPAAPAAPVVPPLDLARLIPNQGQPNQQPPQGGFVAPFAGAQRRGRQTRKKRNNRNRTRKN